jgi:hypothetical protein
LYPEPRKPKDRGAQLILAYDRRERLVKLALIILLNSKYWVVLPRAAVSTALKSIYDQ